MDLMQSWPSEDYFVVDIVFKCIYCEDINQGD